MKIRRASLATNIALMMSVTIAAVAAGVYFFTAWKIEGGYRDEKVRQIGTLMGNIAGSIRDPLAVGEREAIEGTIGRLIRNRDEVMFCIVRDQAGVVVFDSTYKRAGKKFDPAGAKWGEGVIVSTKKIYSGKLVLGDVTVGYSVGSPGEDERAKSFIYIGRTIGGAVETLLRDFDLYHIGQLIRDAGKTYPDIMYITVYDTSQTVVDEYVRKKGAGPPGGKLGETAFSASPVRPVLVQRFDTARGEALDIAVLLESGGEPLGVVRLGYSLAALEREAERQRMRLVGVVTAFIVAGLLFSLYIARRIARPVRALSDAAERVGEGDLDVAEVAGSGGRELRDLAKNFNGMVKGLREREMIRATFSRYVSKQVADELLSDPGKVSLGGTRMDVVTMFCDVQGFTTISEQDSPENVVAMLNDFFSEMVPIIFMHEGTLDKYIGDAFMAVFGSPTPVENEADKAVDCAVEIQKKMVELNASWRERGLRELAVGIGVNYGSAISGNIGYEERMEYTVIGDSVNVAARVEQLTRKYETGVVVTGSVVARCTREHGFKLLDSIQVKGKSEPVEVYAVGGGDG